jgi:hypothetical protein
MFPALANVIIRKMKRDPINKNLLRQTGVIRLIQKMITQRYGRSKKMLRS